MVEDFSDHIGERLQKARELAGLEVEDVTFKTRIPRSVIEALEAGDFSVFSTPTYAKSFLSQYSDYLNVDASLWLDALEPAAYVPSGDIMGSPWIMGQSSRDRPVRDSRNGADGGPWPSTVIYTFIMGMVLIVGIKGYEYFDKKLGGETAPKVAPAAEETPAEPAANPPRANTPPKAVVQPEPPKAIVMPEPPEDAEEEGPPPRAIIPR